MKSVKCGFYDCGSVLYSNNRSPGISAKVSFSAPVGKPLIEVLEEFAGKTRMRLVYSKADIKELKVKSIKCDNIPVNACLKDITTGLPIVHRLRGDLISIKYQGSDVSALGDGRVSGKIVDEIGNPIINADVSIAGKNAVTDSNGDFSIELSSGIYTLIVKAPKYNVLRVEKLQIANNETNTVSFILRSASDKIASIKEVVITGTRKADTQAGLLALQKKQPR